ncbi:MAG: hypothetical protein R3A51_18260 [Nannocystaceae bacterium]|nr:hypothetical protein [Myxococcales bacterium]
MTASASLERDDAALLAALLAGFILAGQAVLVTAEPPIPRPALRAARLRAQQLQRDRTPGFDRSGTVIDPEAAVGLTPASLALSIGLTAGGRRVVDAGCGAGGNAIGFARAGCTVTAIEHTAARLVMARTNARVYGVEDQIAWIAADAFAWIEAAAPTRALLFVDPPWGLDWQHARPSLEAMPLLAAAHAARDRFAAVWAKLPPSFVPAALPEYRPEAVYGLAEGDRRRIKFLLLRWP